MRKDFDKLLCERPRAGGDVTQKRRADNPFKEDELPQKQGMRKPHILRWSGKELSDNIAPLYRYLNGQVGRPWNDVYSEIRKMVGKNPNAVKGHILQHLYGWNGIHLNTETIGKQVFRDTFGELSPGQLYVDNDGVIRRYKQKVKRFNYVKDREDTWMETARNLSNGNQARKINGIWYEVVLKPILEEHLAKFISKYGYITYEVFANDILGTRGDIRNFEQKYRAKVYAVSKRTMSAKQLRENELENDNN